jgi:hypothetical protein
METETHLFRLFGFTQFDLGTEDPAHTRQIQLKSARWLATFFIEWAELVWILARQANVCLISCSPQSGSL